MPRQFRYNPAHVGGLPGGPGGAGNHGNSGGDAGGGPGGPIGARKTSAVTIDPAQGSEPELWATLGSHENGGYPADVLAGVLLPQASMCNRGFELTIDDHIFVGHPMAIQRPPESPPSGGPPGASLISAGAPGSLPYNVALVISAEVRPTASIFLFLEGGGGGVL